MRVRGGERGFRKNNSQGKEEGNVSQRCREEMKRGPKSTGLWSRRVRKVTCKSKLIDKL